MTGSNPQKFCKNYLQAVKRVVLLKDIKKIMYKIENVINYLILIIQFNPCELKF